MIDIHSHILPGLDDGARNKEEALLMLQQARDTGTTVIAATPHANPTYHFDLEQVDRLLLELQAEIGTGIVLVRGSDFHLTHNNIMDAVSFPFKYALNGRRYLLVELSDLVIFPNTHEQYQRLEDAGLRLIVTHPERNLILQRRPELIEEWVAQGRLMQVTAGSLLGRFGKTAEQLAIRLVDQGMAHFLASDAHDTSHRPPRMDQGYRWLVEHHSKAMAEKMCVEHPSAAIEGNEIDLKGFPPTRMPERPAGGFLSRLFGR